VELHVVAQRETEATGAVFDGPFRREVRIKLLIAVDGDEGVEQVDVNFSRGGACGGWRIDVVQFVPDSPGERATASGLASGWSASCLWRACGRRRLLTSLRC